MGILIAIVEIVLLCVGAAVTYGVLHDQVTARICVEYFAIGHANIVPTHDPTWLALGWGTLATWWVGLGLGLPLALLAQFGPQPRLDAQALVQAILAVIAGFSAPSLRSGASRVATP